ncbi:MAG: copper amine oxidase N-terminal domain-containing protein [Clostridia bacterium]|nr:copper amine oxidase N-terminal domain-containing protein [Clostridia bacterium]
MKKVITTVLVVLLSLSSVMSVYATNWSSSDIKLSVNDTEINFPDQKPVLDEDTYRTYVPVRFLAENLGAEVYWNQEYGVVEIVNKYIEGKDTKLVHYLRIGSNKFVTARYEHGENIATKVNVYELPEDVFPVILNSRTMLPFRYVAEFLGAQVYYDDSTSTAHCVKRDMTKMDKKVQNKNNSDMGTPVLSTVLGEYWTEELNKYRASKGMKPVVFDGTYADIMAWAAFNQMEHPEIEAAMKELSYVSSGWMHMFEVENKNFLKNVDPALVYELSDGSKLMAGAFRVFVPQYIPNSSYGQKNGYDEYIHGRGYNEIAFTTRSIGHLNIPWETKVDKGVRGQLRKTTYEELTGKWGIKIALKEPYEYENWQLKPLEKNQEYSNVNVFNDEAYRNLVNEAISTWQVSYTHDQAMLGRSYNTTGFAWVGGYCYAGFHW